MHHDFLAALHKATPVTDKILAVVGTAMAATLTLGHVQTVVGIAVGVLTALALVPRVVIGWAEMRRKLRAGEKAGEAGEG